MKNKEYKVQEQVPDTVAEPEAVRVRKRSLNIDPNEPFHGTQEEWCEHIHAIEQGEFMSLEEFYRRFDAWKEDYLAKKLKTRVKST